MSCKLPRNYCQYQTHLAPRDLLWRARLTRGLSRPSDASGDVCELVARYLQEIEELRARLMESESTCEQLRKRAVNRNLSRLSSSPRHSGTGETGERQ